VATWGQAKLAARLVGENLRGEISEGSEERFVV